MKKLNRIQTLFLSFVLLTSGPAVCAQEAVTDTVATAQVQPAAPCDAHGLSLTEVLVPTTIFGVSALFTYDGWFSDKKHDVQNALSAGERRVKFDDYMQYLPAVAVYGLNLCGVKGKHRVLDQTIILAMSYATMGIIVNSMKYTIREKRPDSSSRNSFPSGHTATAFMGAEFLYREYKDVSPWIGYSGYAVAALTGYLRVYNNRHYLNDVIAGACVGILSTKIAYWLYPKIFTRSRCARERVTVVGAPYYSPEGLGVNLSISF